MLRVIAECGKADLAYVYIAEDDKFRRIEFVESLTPPYPIEEKWVNIVSTLYGCPVNCAFCDAGHTYQGKLSAADIFYQIDYLIGRRFPNKIVTSQKWKIQFARMGEPSFNDAVLEVLALLPVKYPFPGLLPSISTIAPSGRDSFFQRLLLIKREYYPLNFQFQFSLHTTDDDLRRKLIPFPTWDFPRMAEYGEKFFQSGGRKIALNFALVEGAPVEGKILRKHFDPAVFLIKITPVNPTFKRRASGLNSLFDDRAGFRRIAEELQNTGYKVIESVGELEENAVGSNCGQFVTALAANDSAEIDFYRYKPTEVL